MMRSKASKDSTHGFQVSSEISFLISIRKILPTSSQTLMWHPNFFCLGAKHPLSKSIFLEPAPNPKAFPFTGSKYSTDRLTALALTGEQTGALVLTGYRFLTDYRHHRPTASKIQWSEMKCSILCVWTDGLPSRLLWFSRTHLRRSRTIRHKIRLANSFLVRTED